MNKKYLALVAGVGAAMAIGAPMAMAATPEIPSLPGGVPSLPGGVPSLPGGVPSLPGAPGAEPNGAVCSFQNGSASENSSGAQTPLQAPDVAEGGGNEGDNEGNCQSFGNDQHNGEYSNQDYTSDSAPQVPTQDEGIPNS